jgi:hypothetical protein
LVTLGRDVESAENWNESGAKRKMKMIDRGLDTDRLVPKPLVVFTIIIQYGAVGI